ncbi:MAG: hypothetical protein BWZ10_02928 [candidate division BRC1 bacterium ADurb.BinA364]|nr:MAG: hypothetical protein BWZ10_02928 [candidate division BRC1 bacterium ADurb.BinA364]
MLWLIFGLWAWAGCALLFLLNPWPEEPRWPWHASKGEAGGRGRQNGAVGWAAIAGLGAMALTAAAGESISELLGIVIFVGLLASPGAMVFAILAPWPGWTPVPRLGKLPANRKSGALGIALFLVLPLVALADFAYRPFLHIVSGKLFFSAFDRSLAGFVLDRTTIGKYYFLAAHFAAIALPFVAAAHWAGDRSRRAGCWAFAAPTAAIFLCLLSVLTIPFWWVIQYIASMGVTLRRLCALIFGLGGYAFLLSLANHWLDFFPLGFRLRRFLLAHGYEWAELADSRRLARVLGRAAWRLPPASEVETIPGSRPDADYLIEFIRAMAKHKAIARQSAGPGRG